VIFNIWHCLTGQLDFRHCYIHMEHHKGMPVTTTQAVLLLRGYPVTCTWDLMFNFEYFVPLNKCLPILQKLNWSSLCDVCTYKYILYQEAAMAGVRACDPFVLVCIFSPLFKYQCTAESQQAPLSNNKLFQRFWKLTASRILHTSYQLIHQEVHLSFRNHFIFRHLNRQFLDSIKITVPNNGFH
jgi:hypothetical protein